MFNHNFIVYRKKNRFMIYNLNHEVKPLNLRFELNFEIDKSLSFYIFHKGFMFYFYYESFSTFTGDFIFSFLDYVGNTKYLFKVMLVMIFICEICIILLLCRFVFQI